MTRWVLLRGLSREAGHWGPMPGMLARAVDGDVLTPDLPGNGTRHAERSPDSVAGMATAVRAQVGRSEPVWILAMSLGGMVAIEWARTAPQEVAGCVLVNTSVGAGSPPWHRLRPGNWPAIARLLLPGVSPADRERRVLAMTSSRPGTQAHCLPGWTALAEAHPVSPLNAVRQLRAAARYRATGRPPLVPVLLLASEGDRLVHPACSRQLAARWQLPLRMHPWAGHDVPLDDPAWVVAQAAQWASGVRDARATSRG